MTGFRRDEAFRVDTRQFEAAREGYEDYMLMDLLRNRNPQKHKEVMAAYRHAGLLPVRGLIYDALRSASRVIP